MTNALLAWEMGAGFGHLVTLRAIARELRQRGHNCSFAARMLGNAREFLDAELGPIWQAPIHLGAGRNPVKTQVSYASLLHNTGFDDPAALAGRIEAWRLMLRTLKIDLVFADHSPAAIIAAKTLQLPVCHVGTGFTIPPLLAPFPSFRPRMSVPAQVLTHNERETLKELNLALERLKLAPFADLQEIFRGTLPALLGYRELDHYEVARPEPYLGLPDYSYGDAPEWPAGTGPKLFAYLRPIAQLDKVLEGLQQAPARVLLRISGLPPAKLRPYLRPGFAIVEKPINFRLAAESCDAFVNYSASSTVSEFLLAGKPGVLVPDLHERVLVARRAVGLGAALAVRGQGIVNFGAALRRVLGEPSFRQAAAGFAASARSIARDQILPNLVDKALEM